MQMLTSPDDSGEMITIAEAARLADRSKTVIRRWVVEGWLGEAYRVPGRNGTWYISRARFEHALPELLDEMASRRGGRGHRATDAAGNLRQPKNRVEA